MSLCVIHSLADIESNSIIVNVTWRDRCRRTPVLKSVYIIIRAFRNSKFCSGTNLDFFLCF